MRFLVPYLLALAAVVCITAFVYAPSACSESVASASETSMSEDDLIAAALRDDPGWTVYRSMVYFAGGTNHADIDMFRVTGQTLCTKTKSTVTNALFPGEAIPWQEENNAPIPLTSEASERLAAMLPKDIFGYGEGANIHPAVLEGCAEFMLSEKERLTGLYAYPNHLVATTLDDTGRHALKIANWDGEVYQAVTASAGSQQEIGYNTVHSWNHELEISIGDIDACLRFDSAEGWRVKVLNTGGEVIMLENGWVSDISWGTDSRNNDCDHYGRLTFQTALEGLDLSLLPTSMDEVLALLDSSMVACTRVDGAPLYLSPGSKAIAECYKRTAGTIIKQQGDWVCLRIGSETEGASFWLRKEDVVFGRKVDEIVCGFPAYDLDHVDEMNALELYTNHQIVVPDWDWDDVWLIGTLESGDWLVLVNHTMLCIAPKDTFRSVGPTEHFVE